MRTRCALFLALLAGMLAHASAATLTIKMLTKGPNGTQYVFDPMFARLNVGDTVVFQPVDKNGHTSTSVLVPGGAKSWKALPNAEISIKLEKSGVYLVECDVHKTMGMVAVLQVGKPVNLAEAKKEATEASAHMAMNKDRFDKLLALVK